MISTALKSIAYDLYATELLSIKKQRRKISLYKVSQKY